MFKLNLKLIKILVVASLSFGLFSCSYYTKVKLLKPAEINIGNAKKIAILDFNFSGTTPSSSSYVYSTKNKANNNLSKFFTDNLTKSILDNGHFIVIERNKLSSIMAEQGLASSGFVNPQDSMKLGNLSGAQLLLIGSGEYTVKDTKEYSVYTISTSPEKKTDGFYFNRKAQVEFSYRVIDVSTGVVLGSKSFNQETNSSTSVYPENPKEVEALKSYSKGNNYENMVRNFLGNADAMVNDLAKKISLSITNQIAPHYIFVEREIKNGNSNIMQEAIDMTKIDLWNNAKDIWESVLSKPELANDHEAALYNLALYYEITGNLKKSYEVYNEVYKKTNNPMYAKARDNVYGRIFELDSLKEQGRIEDTEVNKKNINHLQEADKYIVEKDFDKAINELRAELTDKPTSDIAHYKLGLIFKSKKDLDKAIFEFQEAIRLNSQNAQAYFELGSIYIEKGLLEEGRFALKEAFKLNPELSNKKETEVKQNHFERGQAYFNNNKLTEAANEFNLALKDNPRDPNIYNYLGAIYLKVLNYNDAEKIYRQGLLFNPDNASLHFNLGITFESLGNKAQAKVHYDKACKLGIASACK